MREAAVAIKSIQSFHKPNLPNVVLCVISGLSLLVVVRARCESAERELHRTRSCSQSSSNLKVIFLLRTESAHN